MLQSPDPLTCLEKFVLFPGKGPHGTPKPFGLEFGKWSSTIGQFTGSMGSCAGESVWNWLSGRLHHSRDPLASRSRTVELCEVEAHSSTHLNIEQVAGIPG